MNCLPAADWCGNVSVTRRHDNSTRDTGHRGNLSNLPLHLILLPSLLNNINDDNDNEHEYDNQEAATCQRQDMRLVAVDLTLTWSPPGPDTRTLTQNIHHYMLPAQHIYIMS